MTIVAKLNLGFNHLDIQTMFLDRELELEVYIMQQPLNFENHRNWLAIHCVMYYKLRGHSIHTYTIICMCVASLFNIESVDAHNLDYESIIFFKPRYIYLDGLKPRLHEILLVKWCILLEKKFNLFGVYTFCGLLNSEDEFLFDFPLMRAFGLGLASF